MIDVDADVFSNVPVRSFYSGDSGDSASGESGRGDVLPNEEVRPSGRRRWAVPAAVAGTVAVFAAGIALSGPSSSTSSPTSSAAVSTVAATDPTTSVADAGTPPANDEPVIAGDFAVLVPVIPAGYDVQFAAVNSDAPSADAAQFPVPQLWASGPTAVDGPWLLSTVDVAGSPGTTSGQIPTTIGERRARLANGTPAVVQAQGMVTAIVGPGVEVSLSSKSMSNAQLLDVLDGGQPADRTLRTSDGSVVLHQAGEIPYDSADTVQLGFASPDSKRYVRVAVGRPRELTTGERFYLVDTVDVDGVEGRVGTNPYTSDGTELTVVAQRDGVRVTITGNEDAGTLVNIAKSIHPASRAEWNELERRSNAEHQTTSIYRSSARPTTPESLPDGTTWSSSFQIQEGSASANIQISAANGDGYGGYVQFDDSGAASIRTQATYGTTFILAFGPTGATLNVTYADGTVLSHALDVVADEAVLIDPTASIGTDPAPAPIPPVNSGTGIADTSTFAEWTATIVGLDGTVLATAHSDGT